LHEILVRTSEGRGEQGRDEGTEEDGEPLKQGESQRLRNFVASATANADGGGQASGRSDSIRSGGPLIDRLRFAAIYFLLLLRLPLPLDAVRFLPLPLEAVRFFGDLERVVVVFFFEAEAVRFLVGDFDLGFVLVERVRVVFFFLCRRRS